MSGRPLGVSGCVQYDLDIKCYSDAHSDPQHMFETAETSDKTNAIVECPECGVRRAVNVHVAPVGGQP